MDKQTLYFERPPQTSKGDFEWTRFPNLAGTTAPNGETCLYMDAYMMREFGHAAGLGHNRFTHKIMSHLVEHSVIRLASDDEYAMKRLYGDNNHHAIN